MGNLYFLVLKDSIYIKHHGKRGTSSLHNNGINLDTLVRRRGLHA